MSRTGTPRRVVAAVLGLLLVASVLGPVGTITAQDDTIRAQLEASPQANFSVSPTDPERGDRVTFDANQSTGGNGSLDYEWTITGDGVDSHLLLYSDFEEGSLADAEWTHNSTSDTAEGDVGATTSNSGRHSAFNSWGEAALESPVLDTTDNESITVEYWVREGNEPYGENPNPGEDLSVEYRAENGSWVDVELIETDGGGGDVFEDDLTINDEAAFHDGFQLRFYQFPTDYMDTWHIDDVTVTAQDGTDPVTDTGETMTHAFGQPGEYTVELTVIDEDGANDTATETVTVSEPTHDPYTLEETIARLDFDGDSSVIETHELQHAINYHVEELEVPGTEYVISGEDLDALIAQWIDDLPAVPTDGGDD